MTRTVTRRGSSSKTRWSLVSKFIPEPTAQQVADAMRDALPLFHRVGLTGVHDFDGARALQAWQILKERGELNFRVSKTIPVALQEHAIALGIRSGFGDDWLRINSVKTFADGALGPQTALMIDPYEGTTDNRGISTLDKEEMFENVRKASAAGLSSTIHAIGDKANHDVLDVFAMVRREEGSPRLRHRIEHVQLLHPDDFNRLAQLNVIASMQPIHATSDMLIADRLLGQTQRGRVCVAHAAQRRGGAGLRIRFARRVVQSSSSAFTLPSRAAAPMDRLTPMAGIPSSASP